MSQALDDYTMDFYALKGFELKYVEVLSRYQELKDHLAESEAALKEHARLNGSEANDDMVVSVQTKIKRWYDADTLLAKARWLADVKQLWLVDTKAVEKLIKAGAIPADLVAEAIRTEDMTPAVSIKIKTPEPAKTEVTA